MNPYESEINDSHFGEMQLGSRMEVHLLGVEETTAAISALHGVGGELANYVT